MRGADKKSGSLFSYVDLEGRLPAKHPLRPLEEVLHGKVSRCAISHGNRLHFQMIFWDMRITNGPLPKYALRP